MQQMFYLAWPKISPDVTYILFVELPIKWMMKAYINTYTYRFAVFWRLWSYLELGENDPNNVKSESRIWSSVSRYSCCTSNASNMIFKKLDFVPEISNIFTKIHDYSTIYYVFLSHIIQATLFQFWEEIRNPLEIDWNSFSGLFMIFIKK